MVFLSETFDEHVVYVDLHYPPYHVPEHFGDHSLVGCPCIFQTKWHHLVAICPSWCDKICLVLIGNVHWDLIVALKCIQEAQLSMSRGRIHLLIYSRKWKRVFQASFVQISEVNTNPSFPIFLFYHHRVREPHWVLYFSDCSRCQKVFHFLKNCSGSLWGQLPSLLNYRPMFGPDIQ